MKRLVFSLIFLISASLLFAAAAVEKDKVIEKEFSINSNGTVQVGNKYGNVTVKTTDQNKVRFKVTIEVKTNSDSKAEEVFKRVDINFEDNSNLVSAITEIEDQSNWSSWMSSNDGPGFNVHYEVWMPKTVNLKLSNKYGDVSIPDVGGDLELEMKYGNVSMQSVDGKTKIDLGYGKIDFGDLNDVDANIKYSDFRGSSTQALALDTKYSQYAIGDISELRASSKYDQFAIEEVKTVRNEGKYDQWKIGLIENLTSDTKYTDFELEELKKDLKISQKYGSIIIRKLMCTNADIVIDVEHTNVEIGAGSCGLDIDYRGEYTGLKLPSSLDGKVEKDSEDTWLNAKIGNGERKIKLNMEYGKLKIM